MKIIYVTTCINPKRFFQGNKENKKALNPSGQNFHYKMIKALKEKCDVEVISIPPLSPYLTNRLFIPRFEEEVEGIKFHYVRVSYSKLYKFNTFDFFFETRKVLNFITCASPIQNFINFLV